MKLHITGIVFILFILVVITGCEIEKISKIELEPDKEYTITVMDEKDFFMNRFGKLIVTKYPNVVLNFVLPPVPEKGEDRVLSMVKFIEQHRPDLLYLGFDMYKALSAKQLLLDLYPYIKSDKYDLESFHAGVIERLRDGDPSHLYGLSPTFVKKGLYYNIDLFEKYDVRLPTNQMTWEDVIGLAKKIQLTHSGSSTLAGVYIDDLYANDNNLYVDRMFELGAFERLQVLNREGTRLQIEDRRWRAIWSFLQTNFRSGALVKAASPENKQDLFIQGQAAMAFAPDGYIQLLDRNMKGKWGVVSEPVSREQTQHSYSLSVREVFAVSAASSNTPVVWELMKFIHGDEIMQLHAQSTDYGHLLFSRENVPMMRGRADYSAFYKLKRWLAPVLENTSPEYLKTFSELAELELTNVIEEGKSVEQALKDLQEKGQQALTP